MHLTWPQNSCSGLCPRTAKIFHMLVSLVPEAHQPGSCTLRSLFPDLTALPASPNTASSPVLCPDPQVLTHLASILPNPEDSWKKGWASQYLLTGSSWTRACLSTLHSLGRKNCFTAATCDKEYHPVSYTQLPFIDYSLKALEILHSTADKLREAQEVNWLIWGDRRAVVTQWGRSWFPAQRPFRWRTFLKSI